MNLQETIFAKINDLGHAEAATYFNTTENNIRKWTNGQIIPIAAGQKVLDDAVQEGRMTGLEIDDTPLPDGPEQGQTIPAPRPTVAEPKPQEEVPLVQIMQKARKFSILCPTYKDLPYATAMSLLGQWKYTLPPEIRSMLAFLDFEPDTNVHFARNRLASRFLESGAEWSFWMDADMIAPVGSPGWYKRRTGATIAPEFAGLSAIEQLTSHKDKYFVSGVYCERNPKRHIVAQPGMDPRSENEKTQIEAIRKGPQRKLMQVEWCGFGCVAVHRKVFEDILEKVPGVKSDDKERPHEFFTQMKVGNQGEDMAMCERARMAGHQIWLDLSVYCSHIGRYAYNVTG